MLGCSNAVGAAMLGVPGDAEMQAMLGCSNGEGAVMLGVQ